MGYVIFLLLAGALVLLFHPRLKGTRTLIAGWLTTVGLGIVPLLAAKATRTMRSRHLPGRKTGFSHAVDFAVTLDGKVKWDWPLYARLAKIVKQAARDVGVTIEWGGDWSSFKDGPHYQLPWAKYPG